MTDDFDLVRSFRGDTPGPSTDAWARAKVAIAFVRASEVAAADVEVAGPSSRKHRLVHLHTTRRRWGLALIAAVAVAALALGLTLPGGSGVLTKAAPTVQLAAARFLHRAAVAALQQPAAVPQPGQYIYSEGESATGDIGRTWLSVDGTSPVRVTDGSNSLTKPGTKTCTVAQAETRTKVPSQGTYCIPINVGYFPDLPTQPKAVLTYFEKIHLITTATAAERLVDNMLGKLVLQLGERPYFEPAQRAAIYNLLAETPGFNLVTNVKDAFGRVGVGIEWQFEGGSGELIFNPTTYAFLGGRTWPGPPNQSAPHYYGGELLAMAIVNQAAQVPSTAG